MLLKEQRQTHCKRSGYTNFQPAVYEIQRVKDANLSLLES